MQLASRWSQEAEPSSLSSKVVCPPESRRPLGPQRGSRRAQVAGELHDADGIWLAVEGSRIGLAISDAYEVLHSPLTIRQGDRTIAREGDLVTAVGGFLPDDDPRVPPGGSLFFASDIHVARRIIDQ